MGTLKDFSQIILKIESLIETHGFQLTSASYQHGGFIFEFDLITGNGPFLIEAQFRLLQDPKDFELRVEKRVRNSDSAEPTWVDIASRRDIDVHDKKFFPTIETLISRCLVNS